jgi:hypothetical protein
MLVGHKLCRHPLLCRHLPRDSGLLTGRHHPGSAPSPPKLSAAAEL